MRWVKSTTMTATAAVLMAIGLTLGADAAETGVPIAMDSYLVHPAPQPTFGEYAPGIISANGDSQNPATLGFDDAWIGSTGTMRIAGAGLDHAGMGGSAGGSVRYQHTASLDYRSIKRVATSSYNTDAGTFYLAGLMSFDENFGTNLLDGTDSSSSVALTSFLNSEEGNDPLTLGVQWGFKGDGAGGVNAIVRVRDDNSPDYNVKDFVIDAVTPGTHMFALKVELDIWKNSSTDRLSVWLNPTAGSSEAAAGPATLVEETTGWVAGSGNTNRIVDTLVYSAGNVGADATVHYDEFRFGETWNDVVNSAAGHARFQQGHNGYTHLGSEVREGKNDASAFADNSVILTGADPGAAVGRMRTVLAFELQDIPDGAIITDVNLTLAVQSLDIRGQGTGDLELRLVQHASASMVESEVRWTDVQAGIAWDEAGGDIGALLSLVEGFDSNSANASPRVFEATEDFLAAVQAALDAGMALELAVLAPEAEARATSDSRNLVRWHSDDATDLANRPALTINWTLPAGAVIPEPGTLAIVVVAASSTLGARNCRSRARAAGCRGRTTCM